MKTVNISKYFNRSSFLALILLLLTACSTGGGNGDVDNGAGDNGVNDNIDTSIPLANYSPKYELFRNESKDILFPADIAEIISHTNPIQGTITADGRVLTYTPNQDANGRDSFGVVAHVNSADGLRRINVDITISKWSLSYDLDLGYATQVQMIKALNDTQALLFWNASDTSNLTSMWSAIYQINDGLVSSPVLVSSEGQDSTSPKFSINASNHGMLIWREATPDEVRTTSYGPPFRLKSRIYNADAGFATEEAIIVDKSVDLLFPISVDVDEEGNAAVIWQERTPDTYELWSSIYRNNEWEPPVRLDTYGDTANAKIKMQSTTNILVTWQQPYFKSDPTPPYIVARHFGISDIWGPEIMLSNVPEFEANSPDLAMNADGEAVIIWQQTIEEPTRSYQQTYVSHFTAENGFTTPVSMHPTHSSGGYNNTISKVVPLIDNKFLGIWHTRSKVYSNVYDPLENSWGDAIEVSDIENGAPLYIDLDIASDANGNAIAAWSTNPDTLEQKVWTAQYLAGTGWRYAERVDADRGALADSSFDNIDMDESGTGFLSARDGLSQHFIKDYVSPGGN